MDWFFSVKKLYGIQKQKKINDGCNLNKNWHDVLGKICWYYAWKRKSPSTNLSLTHIDGFHNFHLDAGKSFQKNIIFPKRRKVSRSLYRDLRWLAI